MTITSGLDMEGRVTDWAAAYKQGYRFAVPRCVGENGAVDPDWAPNVDGARAAGLLAGAYHFIAGGTSAAHCKVFKDAIAPKIATGPLLIWLDIEKPNYHPNPTAADVASWFAEWRKDYPTAPVIAYAPRWYVTGYMGGANLAQYTPYLWASLYPPAGTKIDFENAPVWTTAYGGWKGPVGWQYAGTTAIGIGASVDLNVFHGDMAALSRLAAGGSSMAEFIAAGGLDLASTYCIDLKAGTNLYKDETTVGTTLSKDSTVDYLGQSSGFYFVRVSTSAFYTDGIARQTQAMVKPTEFAARPRAKTDAEAQAAAARFYTAPATDCAPAIKAATDPLNAQIVDLTKQVKDAAAQEKERIALASGGSESNRIRNL